MGKTYILYNPYAGNGKADAEAKALCDKKAGSVLCDITDIGSYKDFFDGLDSSDSVILCGGDGTLNRFANDTRGINIVNDIFYYAIGSGNDFARDLGKERASEPDYKINEYIKDLPTVTIDCLDEERVFINGIGYGIDGYCCEMGDAIREKNEKEGKDKKIDYTAIAIKGLLFDYKPTGATVTVDGKEYRYEKVWIAPAMNGRRYGGGMIPTPAQKRTVSSGEEKKLSLMVFHDSSKLKTLMIFPSIFKGEHVKNEKYVTVLEGKEIRVEFDEARTLQIDGETVIGVKYYEAKLPCGAEDHESKAACACEDKN